MKTVRAATLAFFFTVLHLCAAPRPAYDICIYGGTSCGVIAAVQAARAHQSVVLLEDGSHVGGLTSGGLSQTDIGNKGAIGGIAREFYQRMGAHYGSNETWKLEPSVAESVFKDMLREAKAPVVYQAHLKSAQKTANRITSITLENGEVYKAKVFIDASYEGDLMAMAHVTYFVGREANSAYGEVLDGVRGKTPKHQFTVKVDPYITAGHPESGVLPSIQSQTLGTPGAADKSVQAYNFRLCLTQNPTNKLPIDPPDNYDPTQYELLARYLKALVDAGKTPHLGDFMHIQPMPNGKTDVNNNGGFSTDFIGENYHYPEASRTERARIWKAHENYTRGLIRFLADDSRVPEAIRTEMQSWGLCKDEFQDTGGWPHQLYIREARRMISEYVMTENNCRYSVEVPDPVGLAAYTMDSHNCRRIVRDGFVENEGDTQIGGFPPYQISYRALTPKQAECENLLVPVCLSASHIAYGSIRMEPVFMVLGQSAALAATEAIQEKVPVQKIKYPKLQAQLATAGQVLEWAKR